MGGTAGPLESAGDVFEAEGLSEVATDNELLALIVLGKRPSWRVVFSVYDNPKALHAAELRHNADLTGHAVCSGDGETVSEDPAAELEA